MDAIRQKQRDAANRWLRLCFRYVAPEKYSVITSRGTKSIDPKDNIVRQLMSYDKPALLPKIFHDPPLVQRLTVHQLKPEIESNFSKMIEVARGFNQVIRELSSLDSKYKEWMPSLHKNLSRSESKEIRCYSLMTLATCRGSTFVKVNVPYQQVDASINNNLQKNRKRHELLLNNLSQTPPQQNVSIFVRIYSAVRQLTELYSFFKAAKNAKDAHKVAQVAIQFFYRVVTRLDENINSFQPAKEFCSIALSQLGVSYEWKCLLNSH